MGVMKLYLILKRKQIIGGRRGWERNVLRRKKKSSFGLYPIFGIGFAIGIIYAIWGIIYTLEKWYVHNIFTTNLRWQVVIDYYY